jgi:hypothetical protein
VEDRDTSTRPPVAESDLLLRDAFVTPRGGPAPREASSLRGPLYQEPRSLRLCTRESAQEVGLRDGPSVVSATKWPALATS